MQSEEQRDRGVFDERLVRSMERARRYPGFHYAVACVDLGVPVEMDAGAIVHAAVQRLEACLRITDEPPTLRHGDMLVHLHGHEFAILLDGLKELGHAEIAAERVLAELSASFTVTGVEVRLSPSIGIAVSATGYDHADHAVRDANLAMQRARHLGGGYEVFDRAALQTAQTRLQLEADFDGALARAEFTLVYQPIAALDSNRIAGFEALVRWRHPGLGLIAPLEFIPLAEKTGFIVPLGAWVLREACRQLKAWQDAIPDSRELWMSVNLSSLQFRSASLVDDITRVLADYALEPRRLVLELTEGIAMENPVAVRALLLQLRAIGVRVSVDDFGTGHSSLAYLRQFPLHSLKVDRSFVRGIEGNRDMASIVSAVTTMAQQLGLRVVAEGIEKEEQLGLLRALGCEFGQGYLFSRPVDAETAASLLTGGLPPRVSGPLTQSTVAMLASLAPAPHIAARGRRTAAVRWLYVAVALVIVWVSVGMPRPFTSASDGPQVAATVPAGARSADIALPVPATTTPAPRPTPASTPTSAPTPPVAAPSKQTAKATRAAEALNGAAAGVTPKANAPAAVAEGTLDTASPLSLTSLRVVHQHRLGSCRGQLVVSRDGVAYIPEDDGQVKDGFRLRYTQFLNEVSGGSLRISSSDRDYRFRVAVPSGDDRAQLERLAATIARFR